MRSIPILLLTVLLLPAPATARTYENFVERKDVTKIKTALNEFYKQCGFFPDELGRLLSPSINEPGCQTPNRAPLLQEPDRPLTERLEYRPFGYKSYELSVRLIVTDNS